MIYKQKLTKIGNSFGVILPKALLKSLKLKLGNELFVENVKNKIIIGKEPTSNVSAEFLGIAENVGEKYKKAFKELAGK